MRTRDDRSSAGTVTRIVRVLRFVSEREKTTIKETSIALSLAPSTVHRMFELLTREGMIEQDKADRTYRAGSEFFRIGSQVVGHFDVRNIALPLMYDVTASSSETCVLGLYLPKKRKMIFAERVDSTQLLRYELPMNTPLSVLWGASGRSILSFLPKDQIDMILKEETAAPASGEKLPTAAKLASEVAKIRKQGFAVTYGEKVAGAVGVAAPIFRADGNVIGSLSVTAPKDRMQPASIQRISRLIRVKAVDLSKSLGYIAPSNSCSD
jgi:DNA-binding IclR family transcriptional regulator